MNINIHIFFSLRALPRHTFLILDLRKLFEQDVFLERNMSLASPFLKLDFYLFLRRNIFCPLWSNSDEFLYIILEFVPHVNTILHSLVLSDWIDPFSVSGPETFAAEGKFILKVTLPTEYKRPWSTINESTLTSTLLSMIKWSFRSAHSMVYSHRFLDYCDYEPSDWALAI